MKIHSAASKPHVTTSHPKFPGKVKDAGWSPGSGIGPGTYMGITVSVLVNPMTKTSVKMKLDAAKKTITVTLTGKVGRPNLAADTTRQLQPGIPRGMQMGTQYKLIVKDSGGHVLKHTTITPFPAA